MSTACPPLEKRHDSGATVRSFLRVVHLFLTADGSNASVYQDETLAAFWISDF